MAVVLRFLLGLVLAVAVHTLAIQVHAYSPQLLDPFVVLVIYQALRANAIPSAMVGSVVGLTQDAFTGGLFGLHGFANTLVAYLVSAIRQRFLIQQPLQVAVLAALGGAFQLTTLAVLQFSLIDAAEIPHPGFAFAKMLTTGLLTMAVYLGANRFFSWERNRREKRSRRLRLGTRS